MEHGRKARAKHTWSQSIANIFGGLGYTACVMQWLWVMMIYLETIAGMSLWRTELFESETTAQLPTMTIKLPHEINIILATATLVAIIGLMSYIIYVIPSRVARGGRTVTRGVAKKVLPIITHHKKLPPKKTKHLTIQLTWSIKYLLTLAPLLLTTGAYFINLPLSPDIIIACGIVVHALTILWFGCQYFVARFRNLDQSALW